MGRGPRSRPTYRRTRAQLAADLAEQAKTCKICRRRKPFADFHVQRHVPDGRYGTCAECRNCAERSGAIQFDGFLTIEECERWTRNLAALRGRINWRPVASILRGQ